MSHCYEIYIYLSNISISLLALLAIYCYTVSHLHIVNSFAMVLLSFELVPDEIYSRNVRIDVYVFIFILRSVVPELVIDITERLSKVRSH